MRKDRLFSEMSKAIPMPRMTSDDLFPDEFGDINQHLVTKQIIHLPSETVKSIGEKNDIRLPEALRVFHDTNVIPKDEKLRNLKDGYGYSEYFGKHNQYIPDAGYHSHTLTYETDAVLNVYNGISANITIPEIQKLIRPIDISAIDIKEPPFPRATTVRFTRVIEPSYIHDNRVECYMYKFPVMFCNLPYEFYSNIEIPENIYTWNIDQDEYSIAGMSKDEFVKFFDRICAMGFDRPFYMQIRQGKIISMNDDDYVSLLIAKWLKLPSIPTALYMMNNRGAQNYSLISARPIDIINKYIPDMNPDQKILDAANLICNPYFIFQDNRYEPNFRQIVSERYRKIFNYESDGGMCEDSFMMPSDDGDDDDKYSEEPVENVQQRLKTDIDNQINDDIAQALAKLIGN